MHAPPPDPGTLVYFEQSAFDDGTYIDAKIWQDVSSGQIAVKYRLYYGSADQLILCYDNAAAGHQRQVGGRVEPYAFRGIQPLVSDFLLDVIEHRRQP